MGSWVSLLVAAELAALFVGATLPSPLYPLYAAKFHFGGVTLTLIYAAYVVGSVLALMIGGRLSDQIGRRRAMLPALVLALGSALVFLLADNTAWLFPARILSGLATGLGSGVATAWLAELGARDGKSNAAMLATAGNLLGTAIGPLMAGVLADVAPWPLRLSYLVYLVVLAAGLLTLWAALETVRRPTTRLSELKLQPRFGVPPQILRAFLPPAITAFVTFALIGFYAALIPNLLRADLHRLSPAVAGEVICGLFVVATVVAVLSRTLAARTAMLWGLGLLLPSVGLLVAAQIAASMPVLLAATVFAGAAGAFGYRGSLQVVNGIAPAQQRGEVVSTYLIAVYLGNSVPIVGVGLLAALTAPLTAHAVFAAVIAALAVAALLSEWSGLGSAQPAE